MKHAATRTSLVLALLFSTACGGASADAEIASLAPKDTVAFVRIASIDQLIKNARHATIAVGEDPKGLDADTLLRQLQAVGGGKTTLIDRTRPIAIAVAMPGDTPSPVLMVPATDAKAYAASLPPMGGAPVVSGGYVVVALGGKYEKARSPSPLMSNLPSGVVALRVDAEQLVTMLGSEIGANLRKLETRMASESTNGSGIDGGAMAKAFVNVARSAIGAAKTFELSLDYREGQLDVSGSLTVKPGSELDGWGSDPVDLKALASRLSGKGSLELLMAADWGKLWPRIAPFMQAALEVYPPSMRELLRPLLADYEQICRVLGPVVAADGDAFGGSMNMMLHLAPPDATALQRQCETTLGHESLARLGISSGPARTAEVDGASIRDYEVKVDLDRFAASFGDQVKPAERDAMTTMLRAMFGAEHLPLRLASKGGRSVMAIGPQRNHTATLASLDGKGGTGSKPLQAALARFCDCNPVFVERIDFAAMMSMMAPFAGPAFPAVSAGQSADFVFAAGIRQNEWRGQLSIDLTGFAKMMQGAMPR
ncbi:MAG TPA: hypothetical protein VFT55_02955 [Planctomycetota bacterium]|nr:hypothetical protein [Planctomycetota bacterium]